MKDFKKIALVGAGNFGFALASHLDRQEEDKLQIYLYDHRQTTIDYIAKKRTHPQFFPTISLSERVILTNEYTELIEGAQLIILAMVSTALENVLEQIKPLITGPVTIVSIMKALDNDTGKVLTEVIEQKLAGLPVTTAVLVGGTTGEELTQEQYLGMTLACKNLEAAAQLAPVFANEYIQVQISDDILGVQYASSFKNLISLVVGIVAGLGYSYGTQTHALSLTAVECEDLAVSLGASHQTFAFASQCWGNDMVMSATGKTRNRALGELLGEGMLFSEAIELMKKQDKTAESANTLAILAKVADLRNYPILQWLVKLSQGKAKAVEILRLIAKKEIL